MLLQHSTKIRILRPGMDDGSYLNRRQTQ